MSARGIIEGVVAPLDRENVDTDAIIPKQFLKSTSREGYGRNLFDAWRYLDVGDPGRSSAPRRENPGFVLNQPRFRSASILLARSNFGCGSSREHAPWALLQYGITAVIAPSFGDIFRNNALKNGLLVVELPAPDVDALFREVAAEPGYALRIDVAGQCVVCPGGRTHRFDLDPFRKRCLLDGVNEISLALSHAEEIRAWERQAQAARPWSRLGAVKEQA